MKHSFKELFLDILIKNQNGQIITDINNKPQKYLLFKSHHPPPQKKTGTLKNMGFELAEKNTIKSKRTQQ